MPRAPGTTPDWVTPGRCDYCPRPADLVRCVCAGCGHTVGVNVCAEKHADFLDNGEYACRVCAEDLREPQRHICVLSRKAAASTDPGPPTPGLGPFEPGEPDAAEQIVARWIYRERDSGNLSRLDDWQLGAMVRSLLPPDHPAQRRAAE